MPKYLAILKSKDGEYRAWRSSTAAVRGVSRAMFEIGTWPDSIAKFTTGVSRQWPGNEVLIFDAGHINRAGAVTAASAQLRQNGVPAIPTFRPDDSAPILSEVRAAAALHGEGGCLRLGALQFPPDVNIAAALVPGALQAVGLSPQETDLLIDYSVIPNAGAVAQAVPRALTMLQWAASNGPWRSVTLGSGAFPASITTFVKGTSTGVPRFDAALYAQVVGLNPAVVPNYGDYGIQHPSMPPDGGRSPLPNLRYASDGEWQVWREERIAGNDSFKTLSSKVVASPQWAGPTFSAGDNEVDRCARDVRGPGGPREWVQWGLSHHLAHVAHRLTTLGVP